MQPVGGGQSAEPVAQLVETRVGCAGGGARGRSHAEGTLE
ncbi:putative Aminoglycoside phosphotransferase domain protein [Ralstonia insidiosa]|uniref:Aminoglycoside phosphotransferase domain protein n=1 Tax=Ralstonia insidiosa TaxID=190721 RepID=A0AAC9FS57_9RALS|nr:putative Aminoglycoside phosphotransferase domain protein [Ralstonia insidiosa]